MTQRTHSYNFSQYSGALIQKGIQITTLRPATYPFPKKDDIIKGYCGDTTPFFSSNIINVQKVEISIFPLKVVINKRLLRGKKGFLLLAASQGYASWDEYEKVLLHYGKALKKMMLITWEGPKVNNE